MKKFGFILFPAISLGVGALAGFLTKDSLANVYPLLEKSSLTPPGWVFPIAWTVLYLLMGIGMALVEARGGPERSRALTLFGIQLALNFGWSLLFFNSGAYLSPGGLAADPLLTVGGLCRLPERGGLGAELVKIFGFVVQPTEITPQNPYTDNTLMAGRACRGRNSQHNTPGGQLPPVQEVHDVLHQW